jgi:acyl-coenzyme A synthetase/AMP-(fatty) acid ligase/rubrerythrin
MLCPRCRRPLDDEEEGPYICCAEAPIRWQCPDCGKVSEGFAFPYGRCLQCGGKLELRDASESAVADAAGLQAVRTAFEIELGGRAFYQRAAVESRDEDLRALFSRFAVMEGEHMETLSRRYHVDVSDPSAELRVEVAAIFADVKHRPQDPDNLFSIAIALEKRAAEFFSAHAGQVEKGSAEHRLCLELAAEEREHAELLATEFARWRAGKAGLLGAATPVEPPRDDRVAPALAKNGAAMSSAAPGLAVNAAALLLSDHAATRTAVVCGDEQVSYGELRDRVARAAAVWRARGLKRGDRVAIKLADGIDWLVAWLGTIWAGGVAVGVNPRIPAAEWRYILDEAGFNVIVAESADDTPPPWRERVILVADGRRAVAAAAPEPPTWVDGETPAFWVHSSGTSGKPKAVVHAHRCVREIDRVSRERVGITADDRLFASSKIFFAYPLTNAVLAGLKIGATLLLDPRWPTAASVAASATALRPTVLMSVPSLYRSLLNEGLAQELPRAGVKRCISASEALPASLREAWREQTGLPMIDGYGASETLVLVLTAVDGDDGLQPSPGSDVRAIDPELADRGGPTRLSIRSSTLALGYLDRPAAQAESFRDGAFCPADLFVRTPGGGWRFSGREDSLVKIKGRWVNLVDLEEQFGMGTTGVLEAAAVCVADADGVDGVALFYVASPGQSGAVEQSLHARAAELPPYQRPRWLRAIDELPRTATGKLLRRKLRELLRAAL